MTDDTPPPVAALFDALAPTYDTTGVAFFQPIADGLLRELSPQPGQRWLDVGCGPGAVTLPTARAVGPEGSVVGLDISPRMVERCRQAAAATGLANVEAVVGDAAAPPVDGPFDVVASSLVLFFLPDPAAALRAWQDLLRPGGRLGAVTFGPADPLWRALDDVFRPYLPREMRDARTTGQQGPFESDEGMDRLVADAGFVETRTVSWDLPVRFESSEQYHQWTMTTGQRAMWARVPEEDRPAVRRRQDRLLAERAGSDGSVTLAQGVRVTLARRR